MANDWKETWDWAEKIWGSADEGDYSFGRFFRAVAQKRAEAEGWEELGSSDVWHATKWMVDGAKQADVTTRQELMKFVLEASGYFSRFEEGMLVASYS